MRLLGRSWLRLILEGWGGDEGDVGKGIFWTRASWYASLGASNSLGVASLQPGRDVIVDEKGACIFVIAR